MAEHLSKKLRLVLIAVVATLVVGGAVTWIIAANGDEPKPETTITLAGKEWTCQEIIAYTEPCGPDLQAVFDKYGENLDAYVNSGRLGPLNKEYAFEDVAFAGLTACTLPEENAFIDKMMDDDAFEDLTTRVSFLPAWFTAHRQLCPGENPDVFGDETTNESGGYVSEDYVVD